VACDLADAAQIRAAALELGSFGDLDGLVNNAGHSPFKPLERVSVEEWDRSLDLNLRAMFLCVQALLPRMRRGSAVVNIASTRALMSEPHAEAYAASKGGVLALTHALAVSLQDRGIRVNAVAPGWIDVSGLQGRASRPLRLRPADHGQHPPAGWAAPRTWPRPRPSCSTAGGRASSRASAWSSTAA